MTTDLLTQLHSLQAIFKARQKLPDAFKSMSLRDYCFPDIAKLKRKDFPYIVSSKEDTCHLESLLAKHMFSMHVSCFHFACHYCNFEKWLLCEKTSLAEAIIVIGGIIADLEKENATA